MSVSRCVVVLLWCCCGFAAALSNEKNATRGVDEFLTSLTQMIGTVLNTDARYSSVLGDGSQSVLGRPNRPPVADYFDTGRPPFLERPQGGRPYPPPYPENGRPYPPPYPENGGPYPSPYPENGGPYPPPYPGNGGPYPPPPFRPNGLRPGGLGGGYLQQNSVVQALSSISEHDDLRCVPRLLCEVSSGTRPGYYQQSGYYQQQQQQQSSIPFLTKDALITLLTVLNFVDDSPLLMFGRAALLGYNARGDSKYCTTAYPTCPRDPDQLINYLNNHNGGFFRFFNQQLPQYAPQYAPYQRPPYPQQPPYPEQPPYPQRPPYSQRPPYPDQQQNYAPQYPRPQQNFGYGYKSRVDDQQNPRILSGSPGQYYDVPSVNDLQLDGPRPAPMKFPSAIDHGGASNTVSQFTFPSDHNSGGGGGSVGGGNRQAKRVKMIFPDRTGTGGLRADVDKYGNYKGVYYADGAIKFVDDATASGGRPSTIRLPQRRPAEDFDVLGNRLPYQRRPKFQFPRTSE
ncbi:protein pygopus [Acyrthosiphon pisum]|uniref:Uncharacterized protein n=1 Tax=Acyrthosiphon pisum TaxID=7029 RepID=A0A8R1W4S5_ACYPI|nr:protein pygopus [Acyrthosiphon pisum]|eukprot:XP_001950236.1 PREDICTED: protein pygopus [Acyrthosiphon pisum]